MTVALPPGYPDLLGTLAAALDEELAMLAPYLADGPRGVLAFEMTEQCRLTVGGQRVPTVPKVAAMGLESADLVFELMAPVWLESMAERFLVQPEGWMRVAVARMLDRLRTSVGGATIPRGRTLLALRNEKMFSSFRGDFRETAATFGVCAERARQIITAKIKADRAARQKDLFSPPDA